MAPFTMTGVRPVIEVPGDTPTSPVMVVGPVLVTDWPPNTAKLSAAPSGTATPIACALLGTNAIPAAASDSIRAPEIQAVNTRRERATETFNSI